MEEVECPECTDQCWFYDKCIVKNCSYKEQCRVCNGTGKISWIDSLFFNKNETKSIIWLLEMLSCIEDQQRSKILRNKIKRTLDKLRSR